MAIANGMLKPDAQALLHRLRRPGLLFRKLFRCIVPDNGTEFSEPEMVENYRPDPEHNPYKLMPRDARVFYCDIPQDQVTLHPFLLGRKFQKAADKAVLKKSGVLEAKNTER